MLIVTRKVVSCQLRNMLCLTALPCFMKRGFHASKGRREMHTRVIRPQYVMLSSQTGNIGAIKGNQNSDQQ